jgi:hypothetical protein
MVNTIKTQNTIGVFTNSIDVFKNNSGVFINTNAVLSFLWLARGVRL